MATPFTIKVWRRMLEVWHSAFCSGHKQVHECPASRGAISKKIREQAARQTSMGIITAMITARIIQPSAINQQSSFQSGLAISFQVDC